jgi:SagB-type dehydrogenase family enzyme
MNADLQAAWHYHDATKHSLASLRANRRVMDPEIQPRPYKLYRDLDPLPLPRDWAPLETPALDAIAGRVTTADVGGEARVAVPTLTRLARWLLLSAGIMRRVAYANGREMYFRAAACTGALYHIDVYLVCGPLPELAAGVYHFGPHDFALRRLRAGDYRALVAEATGNNPAIAAAPVVAVYASTFWRNAWKYQARAYRHAFWDSGTIVANALAVAAADHLPVHLALGFVDQTIAHLLGLDPARELALALAAVGHDPEAHLPRAPDAPPLALATEPLSTREVDEPAIRAAHAASSLASPEEVRAWRAQAHDVAPAPTPATDAIPLRPLENLPAASIESVIRRRGSTRQFADAAIDFRALSTLLESAAAPIPADFLAAPAATLTACYLIVNAVDGLAPGTYAYDPARRALTCLRAGSFRREAGFLGLGQDLPADASVNVYWLADLHLALARFGNRGYRAAQLEAAIRGGRLYLGAYALGLGATGLTFFDDDVTAFFSPEAAGKSVMFLIALGRGRSIRKA